MIIISVILVVFVIWLLLREAQFQSQNEVRKQGGLRNVLPMLEVVLSEKGFNFHLDEVTSVEYRRNIDQFSFVKIIVRKKLSLQDPFELQMFHVVSGSVQTKTIPYLIQPHHSAEDLDGCLVRMLHEMVSKMQ